MTNNKLLGMIGLSAKAGKTISGTDCCIDAMKSKKAKLIIISKEASEKTKKNFEFYAKEYDIPIIICGEIDDMSKAIGKRNRAIIGIIDKNLAEGIEKIINGGDVIG